MDVAAYIEGTATAIAIERFREKAKQMGFSDEEIEKVLKEIRNANHHSEVHLIG